MIQIPVLIEPVANNGYRARGGDPFGLTAEGHTPEEALQRLDQLLKDRLAQGMQITALELPGSTHPPSGVFDPADPLVQEWLRIMEENRRKIETDADYL